MKTVSEADKAYAAGFFDGEGCVDIRYRQTHSGKYERFNLRIHVPQIDVSVLQWLKENFGGIVDNHGGPKCARWSQDGHNAANFLSTVLPYLRVKRSQAEVAIDFMATFPEKRLSYGRAGFARVAPDVREKRLQCFLKVRQIRKDGNVSPSGNRDPLSTEKAIRGLSLSETKVVDHCGPSAGGEDSCVH